MNANLGNQILSFWIVGLIALMLGPAALAVDYFWTGAGGDAYWHNPANWDGDGAPTNSADTAIFDTQAIEPYTVKFNRNNTNAAIRVRQDTVAIDLNGTTNALNTILSIVDSASRTGFLQVTGGGALELLNQRPVYLGYASNMKGTLVLSGSNTVLDATTIYQGGRANSLGVFRIENGAFAKCVSLIAGDFDSGVGKVVVSNATVTTSYTHLGRAALSRGEMLMTGPDARWLNKGSPEACIGYFGSGELTVLNGAQALYGPRYLYIGFNETATGTVTVAGADSMIGGVHTESAILTVTLGGKSRVKIGEPPALGGIGTLNLFDGGGLQGRGIDSAYYFFIGAESRIRIRDGSIKWCMDGYNYTRNQPFLFSPGSYYTVELTAASEAFTADTPLIWSGADVAGANTNLITDANFELTLAEGFYPTPGAVFRIFKYTGELEGTFDGLPEGSEFHVQKTRFRINYGSRTDDTITLTALPSLGTMILIL